MMPIRFSPDEERRFQCLLQAIELSTPDMSAQTIVKKAEKFDAYVRSGATDGEVSNA